MWARAPLRVVVGRLRTTPLLHIDTSLCPRREPGSDRGPGGLQVSGRAGLVGGEPVGRWPDSGHVLAWRWSPRLSLQSPCKPETPPETPRPTHEGRSPDPRLVTLKLRQRPRAQRKGRSPE